MTLVEASPLYELSRDLGRLSRGVRRSMAPAADVVATEKDVTVYMDVPGVSAEDVEVELLGDVLTVRGERAYPYTGDNGERHAYQRLERDFGTFERVLQVPEGLDPETITASMADGVLTLHLPQPESRKPRRIQIAAGKAEHDDAAKDRELTG